MSSTLNGPETTVGWVPETMEDSTTPLGLKKVTTSTSCQTSTICGYSLPSLSYSFETNEVVWVDTVTC